MFYIILIIWIIFDLFTKYLANIYFQNKINILWDFLFFKYVENTWIAFSIQIPTFLLKFWTIFLIFAIFYYYLKEEKKKNNKIVDFSFGLILAWAIWNGLERIFNWKVIDFIWIKYFSIFNSADTFITIWAILYFYFLYNYNSK